MPEKATCENPECVEKFVPTTPWQRHCCEECRNHCAYLRVTLPKRIAKYEKLILSMSGKPKKAVRVANTRERISKWKTKLAQVNAAMKGR